MAGANDAEDLVDRLVRRKGAVEDGELTFESLRNVIAASAWLYHGRQKLIADSNTYNRYHTQQPNV